MILVASADFVGGRRGDFGPWRRLARGGGFARGFHLRRPIIRGLDKLGRGRRLGSNELVQLSAGRLRTRTVRMNGEERAPSFHRLPPLRNSIVQILVEIRCGDWVD